jgi:hypothetical protein
VSKQVISFVAVATVLALAACGSDPATEAAAGGEAPFTAEEISIAAALRQIEGHHLAAQALLDAGDDTSAQVHAEHPIVELMDLVTEEVAERAEDGQSHVDALEQGTRAAADAAAAGDGAALGTAAEDSAAAVAGAEEALPGGGTEAFTGSVIASLLSTAAHEYEEAVVDGRLELLVEFQDAYAFTTVARSMYDTIAPAVEAASAEEAAEIDEAFEALAAALPGVEAPVTLADAEDVEAAATLIGHELEETVGAIVPETADPDEIWASIHSLLDDIQATYEAGDPDEAAELAAEAYLENYELVEAAVIEAAPAVNAELEPLLGADLRAKIAARIATEELAAMIDRARVLIGEAMEATGASGEH